MSFLPLGTRFFLCSARAELGVGMRHSFASLQCICSTPLHRNFYTCVICHFFGQVLALFEQHRCFAPIFIIFQYLKTEKSKIRCCFSTAGFKKGVLYLLAQNTPTGFLTSYEGVINSLFREIEKCCLTVLAQLGFGTP